MRFFFCTVYCVVFQALHRISCEPFNNYFLFINQVSKNVNCVTLPKVKLEIVRKSFFFQRALVYNTDMLPAHIGQIKSLLLFITALK